MQKIYLKSLLVLLLCAIVINATMVLSVLVWDEDIDKDPAGSYVRSYVQGDDVGSYFADGSIYVEHEWYKIYPETAGFKDTYYLDALGRVYRVEVETWGESDPLGIFLYAKAVIDATAQ